MEEASSPLSPVEEFFVGGAAAARSLALLRAFKIGHVINVAQEEPNAFPGQLKYLRVGLPNGPRVCQQLMEALDQTERFIAVAKESKSRVLLHCSMGQIRAPTLAALVLVYRGRSPAEAAAYVRRRRPISDPDEAILRVLHKYLLKKRKEEDDRNQKAKEKDVDDTTDSKVSEQEDDEPASSKEREAPLKKRVIRSPPRA